MTDKTTATKKISMASTKQEMIDAYNSILKQLEEREKIDLKPEERIERIKNKEILQKADGLSSEGVMQEIGTLKSEIGKMLTQLADRLEEEVVSYTKIKAAVKIEENELQEIYDIKKEAQSLAALIEAHAQKRQELEAEMAEKKSELTLEINTMRADWAKEQDLREIEIKNRETEEAKKRQRDKEEYEYAQKREQMLLKDSFHDVKSRQEKEIQLKKEDTDRQFGEREKRIASREKEIEELRKSAENFPAELDKAIGRALKETTDRLLKEAAGKEELLKKIFEGERNVLATKIESFEKIAKEQREQIQLLSKQLAEAYQKVQDIAVKAVGGVAELKSSLHAQSWGGGEMKKPGQEK